MGFGLVEDGTLIKHNFPEETVFISDDVKVMGMMVFVSADIRAVRIPPTVTTIPGRAFYSCKRMKSVVIPDTVKVIEKEAFGYGYDGKMEDFSILGMKETEAERCTKENSCIFYEVINFGF